MTKLAIALVLALGFCLAAAQVRPVVPVAYHMTYAISVGINVPPYSDGNGEQWVDGNAQMIRTQTSFQNADMASLADYKNGMFYMNQCAHPAGVDPLCYCRMENDTHAFPNLNLSNATFTGQMTLWPDNVTANVWVVDSGVPGINEEFYADPTTGALIRVIQHGFSGDVVMNILSFQAGPIDPDVFDVARVTKPWNCQPMLAEQECAPEQFTTSTNEKAVAAAAEMCEAQQLVGVVAPGNLGGVACSVCKAVVSKLIGVICSAAGKVACALTTVGAGACALIRAAICIGGKVACGAADCSQKGCAAARLC